MSTEDSSLRAEANELFSAFLLSSDDEAEPILIRLISEQAQPLIKEIVEYKFHGRWNPDQGVDVEDVRSSIVMQLLSRLRNLRTSPGEKPIRSFRDYVAVVSFNACSEHFRKSSHWQALKDQLRYALTHHPRLFLRRESDDWICGYKGWSGPWIELDSQSLDRLRMCAEKHRQLRDQITAVFDVLSAPIRFEDLMQIFAGVSAWKNRTAVVASEKEVESLPDHRQSVESGLSMVAELKQAWNQIRELPQKQRMALLLSLRDERGESVLVVFPALGIASLMDICNVLEMKKEEFAVIWKQHPLEDNQIAEILQVTRQQVINLRKCARERLDRRLGRI